MPLLKINNPPLSKKYLVIHDDATRNTLIGIERGKLRLKASNLLTEIKQKSSLNKGRR